MVLGAKYSARLKQTEFCVSVNGAPAKFVLLLDDGTWKCECLGDEFLAPCHHIAEAFVYHRAKEGKKAQLTKEAITRAEHNRAIKQLREDLERATTSLEVKTVRKIKFDE